MSIICKVSAIQGCPDKGELLVIFYVHLCHKLVHFFNVYASYLLITRLYVQCTLVFSVVCKSK